VCCPAHLWSRHRPCKHLRQLKKKEWEENEFKTSEDEEVMNDVLDPVLLMALRRVENRPTVQHELMVRQLWMDKANDGNPLPYGVHATQLLSETGVTYIRKVLDSAISSGIPVRRPNAMNRNGLIIDPLVSGAVPVIWLVKLIEELVERVVRPTGRMLFPDRIGCEDDTEFFAFTILYSTGLDDEKDTNSTEPPLDLELKEHRDASLVTLNLNLNLPHELDYDGSELFFRNYPEDGSEEKKDGFETVRFSPGIGLIHLGAHRHGSLPINSSSGADGESKRHNLIIWLFGKDGDVRVSPYKKNSQMNVIQRWKGCKTGFEAILN